jgi:putative transposase
VLVDPWGLLLQAVGQPANRPERDGGMALRTARAERGPRLAQRFAAGAYQGPQFREGVAEMRPELAREIVIRREQVQGFLALPTRWLVERARAWLPRHRRLAKECEHRIRYALALVHLASIRLMFRKLCNPS